MNETWKNTFDQIHAEPELKEHTKEYLSEKVYRVHDRRVSHFRRLAAASVLCLFLCAAGVCYLFFTPVTYISVDINPSLELSLNCFDRVVSVDGYNDDGKALAESLSLRYMNYMDALNRILESDTIKTLLSENNDLSLTVAGESETQSQKVLGMWKPPCPLLPISTATPAIWGKYRRPIPAECLSANIRHSRSSRSWSLP